MTWYNGQPFEYKEGFISNKKNFLMGMPRLRQIRLKTSKIYNVLTLKLQFATLFKEPIQVNWLKGYACNCCCHFAKGLPSNSTYGVKPDSGLSPVFLNYFMLQLHFLIEKKVTRWLSYIKSLSFAKKFIAFEKFSNIEKNNFTALILYKLIEKLAKFDSLGSVVCCICSKAFK